MSIVELHQFVADFDLPNPSPFCLKAATFLQLADLPYEVHDWSPMRAPLGKAPVARIDGELVSDSSIIVSTLIERYQLDIDQHVPTDRFAMAKGLTRMLEEHTYWVILYYRWVDPEGWRTYRPIIQSSIPIPGVIARPMVWWLRRGVVQSAHSQGLSRHPAEEILRRAIEDLAALEAGLSDGFLGGDAPCSLDASAYAFLEQLAHQGVSTPVATYIRTRPVLMTYLQAMRERAWPDWTFPTA